MYLAEGVAEADNPQGHPAGEKHAMLIFVAGYRNDYAWQEAERAARAQHWRDIEFDKAGQITQAQVAEQDATVRAAFREALECGSAVIVYAPARKAGDG